MASVIIVILTTLHKSVIQSLLQWKMLPLGPCYLREMVFWCTPTVRVGCLFLSPLSLKQVFEK